MSTEHKGHTKAAAMLGNIMIGVVCSCGAVMVHNGMPVDKVSDYNNKGRRA